MRPERLDALRARVVRHTVVAHPHLVPELRLRLITPDCPMWSATEDEVRAAGIDEPFWAFAWAGGQALARFVLDHPEWVRGRTVFDFGAGSGIEGLAAARAGAARVWASDLDPVAVAAMAENAELNQLQLEATTEDLVGRPVEADIVLAGDVTYEPSLAARVGAWLAGLSREGRTVLVADPGRGFLDLGSWEVLARYDAPSDVDADGRDTVVTTVARPRPVRPA